MAEVTILKKTNRQAVVLATGTGTFFCNLTSLLRQNYANSNTLVGLVDQTFDSANAVCSITDVTFCVDGNTSIVRNGTTYLTLSAGQSDFGFARDYGYVINPSVDQDSNANISINFGSNTGTVILGLSKSVGFNEPDLQQLQSFQKP